jgi:HAD superfamily hydrolase (TIGR01509 family)
MTGKFKAVIFDMDGLVLDTEPSYMTAWRQAAATMDIFLPDSFWQSLSGQHGDAIKQRLQKQCGESFALARFQQLSSDYWQSHVQQHGIPVKPGCKQLLQTLKQAQLPYCLATNSPRQAALHCLTLAGLSEVFPKIISRDEVSTGKPAPDIFQKAALEMNLRPADCLVFEDSAVGVTAAIAAGCPCIYVPSFYPSDAWAAEQTLATLTSLEHAVDFIFNTTQKLP